MRITKKRIFLTLLVAMLSTCAALWLLISPNQGPPQIITVGGIKFRFGGVTYGTNTVPPFFAARLIQHLPGNLSNLVYRHYAPRLTQQSTYYPPNEPQLFVWFEQLTNKVPNGKVTSPTAKLANENGMEYGVQAQAVFGQKVAWVYLPFPVAPRRSRTVQCNLYDSSGVEPVPIGSVKFQNPTYGRFPQWKAEPIANAKETADLSVRASMVQWSPMPFGGERWAFREPVGPGDDVNAVLAFSMSSLVGTNLNWTFQSAELRDATGNVIPSISWSWGNRGAFAMGDPLPQPTFFTVAFRGMLWPDESAWLFKLQLKRCSDFSAQELFSFKGVPVPKLDTISRARITNSVGNVAIILTEFERNPDTMPGVPPGPNYFSRVSFEFPGKPPDVAIDLLDMQVDGNRIKESGAVRSEFHYAPTLQSLPITAQTMDFTFTVQKTRTVEFLLKPPQPTRK